MGEGAFIRKIVNWRTLEYVLYKVKNVQKFMDKLHQVRYCTVNHVQAVQYEDLLSNQ